MAELTSYFNDFIAEINPTETQKQECHEQQDKLRELIRGEESLKNIIIDDFLQGSYKRSTAIRPMDDKKLDVDIVIVTNIDSVKSSPVKTLEFFKPFLEKFYKGKYNQQGRSWGIDLKSVELDLVITATPTEEQKTIIASERMNKYATLSEVFAESRELDRYIESTKLWKLASLKIPDRNYKIWEDTDPLSQIKWTLDKNRKCNNFYLDVVKSFKYWKTNKIKNIKYPKGYPLEHLVGYCCPDRINSIAEGVYKTFENIVNNFSVSYTNNQVLQLMDHGVNQNVFKRISYQEFKIFYVEAKKAFDIANKAFIESDKIISNNLWHSLFGPAFPKNDGGGFTPKKNATSFPNTGGRFA